MTRNKNQWLSIAQFLESQKNAHMLAPTAAAARVLAGQEAVANGKRSAVAAASCAAPAVHTPPSNTGVNNVGGVA